MYRVDRGGDLLGRGRLRRDAILPLEHLEGGGEGRGGDLRAEVVRPGAEFVCDRGGEHLLQLRDARALWLASVASPVMTCPSLWSSPSSRATPEDVPPMTMKRSANQATHRHETRT
jgi:hypothetical protein